MLLAAVLTAVVMAALSLAPPQWLAVVLLLVLGAGWIIALTTLNGAAQGVLPNWVRGRGLAIYLMVFNGAMAAGSLLWGWWHRSWAWPPRCWSAASACWRRGCCSTACACRPARPICSRRTIGRSRWSTRRLRTIAAR